MSVEVAWLASYERDYQALPPQQQASVDRALREVRRVAFSWIRGPLPLEEFSIDLRLHYVRDGIWSITWEARDGRMTLALDAPDEDGYPERIFLRRVGGHGIYGDP